MAHAPIPNVPASQARDFTRHSGPAGSTGRRIHVVFSIDTMSVGGTELNALRTAQRLDANRFRVTVVTLRGEGPLTERYAALGIPVARYPIHSLYGPRTIRQALVLSRFFTRENVSVVHCHDQYSNFFSVLAARLAGVPAIIASKRWLHSPPRYRIANGIGFRLASRVLANSQAVADSLVGDDRLSAKRITVIPNFVDESAFTPPDSATRVRWQEELELADSNVVVGIVASLNAIKDHRTLFSAIALLAPRWPALRLVVVGSGPLLDELRTLATTLGISDRVRFAGLRPAVPSYHFLFDVSVLSSISEGFPNSLVEAMAAGRPIVATAVGGVPDAVRHEQNGLLVPPADPPALAHAIEQLLADPARRKQMGELGAQRARREFRADGVVGALEHLYDDLLTRRRR